MARPPLHLKRRAEFLRVRDAGQRFASPGLVMQALARGDSAAVRVGTTVTRKTGGAVVRNRARRRLREAARLVLAERPMSGFDLVLIGRGATAWVPFTKLLADFHHALDRVGVR